MVSSDRTKLTVSGLTEGNDYNFKVFAENRYGTSPALGTEQPIVPKRNMVSIAYGNGYHFKVFAENRYGTSPALGTEQPIVPKRKFGKCSLKIDMVQAQL